MELGSVIAVVVATRLGESFNEFNTSCKNVKLTSGDRTSRLYYPVYYRCHRRCWSLQRRLARHQLAHGCLDLPRLVRDCAHLRSHFRNSDGCYHLCSQLGVSLDRLDLCPGLLGDGSCWSVRNSQITCPHGYNLNLFETSRLFHFNTTSRTYISFTNPSLPYRWLPCAKVNPYKSRDSLDCSHGSPGIVWGKMFICRCYSANG
jgi:hypothetical protein